MHPTPLSTHSEKGSAWGGGGEKPLITEFWGGGGGEPGPVVTGDEAVASGAAGWGFLVQGALLPQPWSSGLYFSQKA